MGGQSLWTGWGSDVISWNALSLLTNATRPPTGISTRLGLTPAAVIVTVAALAGGWVVAGGAGFGSPGPP